MLLLLWGFLTYGYLVGIKGVYGILTTFNQSPDAIISTIMILSQLMIIIFGAIGVISVFYLSNDTERLIPLPIKPAEIVVAKFVSILVNQYIILSPFVLPVFIYFGILIEGSWGYWLKLPIIYLLLPVIPLALVTIVVMFLMKIVNFGKNKDKLIVIGSILLMCLAIAPQFFINNTEKDDEKGIKKDEIVKILSSKDGLVQIIGKKFPPVIWGTKGFTRGASKEGIFGFTAFSGTSLLLFVLLLFLGKKIFYKGLIGIQEIQVENNGGKKIKTGDFSGSSPGYITFFKREFKEMNRTPMFLVNGVVSTLVWPVFILIWISVKQDGAKLQGFFKIINNGDPSILVFIIAGMLVLCSGLNGTPSSSISREGKNFWYSKVLPVSYKTQLAGKYLHSLMIAALGFTGGLIISAILKISIIIILKASLIFIALISIHIPVGLLIDLRKPVLDWENHKKAMKQNPNVFYSIFGMMGFLAITGFAVYKIFRSGLIGPQTLYIILTAFLIILSTLLNYFLFTKADKLYSRLEI